MIEMGKISAFYTMPHPPIVIPEVGEGEVKKIQATYDACEEVAGQIKKIQPDTIIIITPHGPLFRDAVAMSNGSHISGDLGQFRAPQVSMNLEVNNELVNQIIRNSAKEDILIASITQDSASDYGIDYTLDHGSLVPLYFVNKEYKDYKIVHITYGMLPKMQLYKLGMIIKDTVEASNSKAVMIGSGDLSHKLASTGPYDYHPSGPQFDKELLSLLEKGDVAGVFNMDPKLVEEAGECGLRSFYIMLGAMNGYDIKGDLLSYEGTFGVGYGVMGFDLKKSKQDLYQRLTQQQEELIKVRKDNEDPYVRLARKSLSHYLSYGEYLQEFKNLPGEMTSQKRGVFVTLNKEGSLRGCIGTVFPASENIAMEIIRNAVEAGLNDPRFDPVREEELNDLAFSVDVLTQPEKASKSELDPKKYGVIVRSGAKTGLLLPDLDGVDTAEDQLSIALDKGGISPEEDYTIEIFQVIRHR